jgi:hypothetical protein
LCIIVVEPGDARWLADFWWQARREHERKVSGTWAPNTNNYWDAAAATELREAFAAAENERRSHAISQDIRRKNAQTFKLNAHRLERREVTFLALARESCGGDSEKQINRLKEDVRRWHPELTRLLPAKRGRPPGRKETTRKVRPVAGLSQNTI